MANRRPQQNGGHQRRIDFGRNDRNKNFGRSGVSPWQGAGPGGGMPNLLPLGGGPTEATLALASNIINLLQPRQNPVPSLLDMPIRRDFGPNMGRYDRGYGPNRMGNQGNFRRTGNYNRAGERINTNRKPFRPNDGQRQQNKSSPKKEADSKAKPAKESDDADHAEGDNVEGDVKTEGEKKEAPKTRYDDISPSLLKCHICNKSMWDGRSFENHLSGRAHAIMMQKTAESYALTADTMRQEFKIREMKRTRKTGQTPARDFYCAMCDMYAADGAIHRTTVGHRKLKKYLHPTCTSCHKEMPTRIELDEHRLTAEHLKNMQDKQETNSKPKPEVMVISTLTMEQSYLRDDRHRWRRGDTRVDNKKTDGDNQNEVQIKKENEDEEQKEGEVTVKQEEEDLDNETTVLDYNEGDDLSNVTPDMYPAYSTERGVGHSFLSEFRCVQCRLCRKLLDSQETAAVHLRTWRHHQLFLRLIQNKQKNQENPEAEETEAQEAEANKRPLDSDDGGNWKRRKTDAQNGHDDDEQDHDHEMKEEPRSEADGDAEMPNAEELEDWDTVEENNEEANDEKDDSTAAAAEPEQEPEQEPEPEPELEPEPEEEPAPAPAPASAPAPAPAPKDNKWQGSPRGRGTPRGRGRGRGRGRY